MKRIKCICGSYPQFESDLWPSIKLCGTCESKLQTYFINHMPDLLDGNPLAADLLGVELIGDRYRIWKVEDSSVAREFYFSSRQLTLDKPTDL